MMLHNKEKVICRVLIIAVTILMLGYSSVFAFPFQSAIHHHKVFDKKQVSSSSSSRSSETKANSNNNNKNNNQGTSDGSNTSPDNNLRSAETDQQQQQGTGESVSSVGTAAPMPTPTPHTTCEQGSNCTDQQSLSDQNRSSTTINAGTSGQDNNTPFILPFP
jgi:cytoskeletal protein RodZ